MGSKNGLSGKKIGQPESNFGGIFEGDFGTLRHRIFRWRVWHNLTKSEQLANKPEKSNSSITFFRV